MAKHKIVRARIAKIAKELDEFTTQDMYDKLSVHPNNEGRLFAKSRKPTKGRIVNFLQSNKNVIIFEKHSSTVNTVWKWIGDEEE